VTRALAPPSICEKLASGPKISLQAIFTGGGPVIEAETGIKTICRSAQPMSLMGQNPNLSSGMRRQLSPAADMVVA
jgi:hypothetical protein